MISATRVKWPVLRPIMKMTHVLETDMWWVRLPALIRRVWLKLKEMWNLVCLCLKVEFAWIKHQRCLGHSGFTAHLGFWHNASYYSRANMVLQNWPYQWWRELFRCRFDLLNFSMGFNIVAPYMVCVTHKWISPSLISHMATNLLILGRAMPRKE